MRNLLIFVLFSQPLSVFADHGFFAITGVTIHSQQEGAPPLEDGVIVVMNGKISCLGVENLGVQKVPPKSAHPLHHKVCTIPQGIETFAFQGKIVIPGQFESLGRLGQIEVDAEESTHDGVAAHLSNLAHVRAIDGIQMGSRALDAARKGGIAATLVRPLGGALIAGQSTAFRLQGTVIDDALLKSPVAIHVNLGDEAKIDQPLVGARSGQLALLRTLLERAKRLADFDQGKKIKDSAGLDSLQKLRDDPAMLALAVVFAKKQPLPIVVHAHRADDIAAALRLQHEIGFSLIIAGGAEAHLLADRLALASVPVILGPIRVPPYSWATRNASLGAAAILAYAGVTVAIASAETHNARNLRWEAGFSVQNGLPWAVALAAITSTPAQILNLPGLGQIAEGQSADFSVFDGDPLSLQGHLLFVSLAGVIDAQPKQR